MSPGKPWLLLIPIFNVFWHFAVVINVAASLRNEFQRRNIPNADPSPGRTIGLAVCILTVISIVPIVGWLASIAGLVCWIVYWVLLSKFSRDLQPGTPS